MPRRRLLPLFTLLLACLAAAGVVQAQDAAPQASTLSVNVRVVAFDATVRDRHDALVHQLTRDAFTLLVDGKAQPIRYFSEDSDLPLTIGLMVDTSGSQRAYFAEERAASQTFLTNLLTRPQDNAFVIRFDKNVLLLQPFTNDVARLHAALGNLGTEFPATNGPGAGTLLFDALCSASHKAFTGAAERTGRRAVVILTDGEDAGSRRTRDEAIQCAQQADVTVYVAFYSARETINDERFDPRVQVFPHEHLPGRTNVERIARSTGGRVFVVSQRSIESIFAEVQAELRSQYRMGFTPPTAAAGTYHALELKPKDKRLKVQSRTGYYTP